MKVYLTLTLVMFLCIANIHLTFKLSKNAKSETENNTDKKHKHRRRHKAVTKMYAIDQSLSLSSKEEVKKLEDSKNASVSKEAGKDASTESKKEENKENEKKEAEKDKSKDNSGSSEASKDPKNKDDPKPISMLNSLGHEVDVNILLENPPFKVTRCDQIVFFEREYIPDFEDFTKREKSFFSISAYHVHRLKSKNPNDHLQSILLTNSRYPINEPLGAENCMMLDGGANETAMLICANDKKDFENIMNVFKSFEDCRNGKRITDENLVKTLAKKSTDENTLPNLLRKCGMEGKAIDPNKLLKKGKPKPVEQKIQNEEDFWIPKPHKVPGSRDEDNIPQ